MWVLLLTIHERDVFHAKQISRKGANPACGWTQRRKKGFILSAPWRLPKADLCLSVKSYPCVKLKLSPKNTVY
jgi:hypothetical protein